MRGVKRSADRKSMVESSGWEEGDLRMRKGAGGLNP